MRTPTHASGTLRTRLAARRRPLLGLLAAGVAFWLPASPTTDRDALAQCDVIPGTTKEFRGALGTLNRPYAIPGDEGELVTIGLDNGAGGCHDSPGFGPTPGDHVVTILFTPPNGVTNAEILAPDCLGLEAACEEHLGAGTAHCVESDDVEVIGEAPRLLRFRFPDTDARLGGLDDDRTFTGPATIVVTAADSPPESLQPCELSTARCADTLGAIACVDELYAQDGSCETGASHIDPIFGHFTALPPANDFQALCSTEQTECTGAASELRFTVDAAGNALIPMDWGGVLLRPDGIPVPRLVTGNTSLPAFASGPRCFGGPTPGSSCTSNADCSTGGTCVDAIQLPGESFLGAYSIGGQPLPPIFVPLSGLAPISFFGLVDAEIGVMRIARRQPDLTGPVPAFGECTGGENAGFPCADDGDCPTSLCGSTTCRDATTGSDTGLTCTSDAACGTGTECGPSLFDLADQLTASVGPVVIPQGAYVANAGAAVPLDGLIETESMFAFVQLEQIAGATGEGLPGPQPQDLNGDGDTTDTVLVLRDRKTGLIQTIGTDGAEGRAATRIHQPPFRYSAVAAEGDIVAFLEPEPLQGDCSIPLNCDHSGDLDVSDTILRVFQLGPAGSAELTALDELEPICADAEPVVEGRSFVLSDGLVYFRQREEACALHVVQEATTLPANPMFPAALPEFHGFLAGFSESGDELLIRGYRLCSSGPSPLPLSLRFLDGTGDNGTGPDASSLGFAFDNSTGEFAVTSSSWPSAPYVGQFNVEINLFNGDVGTTAQNPSFFSVQESFDLTSPQPHIFLTGVDPRLREWVFRDRVAITGPDPLGVPDGVSAFETVVGQDSFDLPNNTVASIVLRVCDLVVRFPELLVHDVSSGQTDSVTAVVPFSVGDLQDAAFSGDGQWMVASVRELAGFKPSLYLHDRNSGVTMPLDVSNTGQEPDGDLFALEVSRNGRYVVFSSAASNLIPGQIRVAGQHLFLHDRDTGITEQVDVNDRGVVANIEVAEISGVTRMSPDGRFVAFVSKAGNLVLDELGGGWPGAPRLCPGSLDGYDRGGERHRWRFGNVAGRRSYQPRRGSDDARWSFRFVHVF